MSGRVYQRLSDQAPERKQGNPMADPTAKGLGPPIKVTDVQRFDAVRAVEKRRQLDHETYAEAGVLLAALGLLPPPPATGPRTVVCPTCSATVGAPCTQNGGRDTYSRIHVKRTQAAREAASIAEALGVDGG